MRKRNHEGARRTTKKAMFNDPRSVMDCTADRVRKDFARNLGRRQEAENSEIGVLSAEFAGTAENDGRRAETA